MKFERKSARLENSFQYISRSIAVQSLKNSIALQQVLTVSQLTEQIKLVLEDEFHDIHVVGEVSNVKIYPSGHWYFSLKDKESVLPCVCFKNSNQSIKFRLEDGLMVVAQGALNVYPPRGAYQMIVESLKPVGIGDWQLAFEQLKTKLDGEGLLAFERKRSLPLLPRKIGVVTSPAGAALQDILSALYRRNRAVNVLISPCRVQGEGCEQEIAQAIKDLEEQTDIEVILIARGGGSIEDLWAFNTEVVARAVAACRIPVISGVGHETDITICDLVADMRAPTPTAAAELVAKGRGELIDKWSVQQRHLLRSIKEKIFALRHRLLKASPAQFLSNYQHRLQNHRLRVTNLQHRLITAISRRLAGDIFRFTQASDNLKHLSPLNVLQRGFSLVRKPDGEVIRQANQCQSGETLEVLLSQGRLMVTVNRIEDGWKVGREREM